MLESMLAKRHALMLGSVLRIFLQWGRPGFDPWVGKIPEEGYGNPFQYSCLENPVGQRSLVGYSPWYHEESDTTEWLRFSLSLFHVGACPRAGEMWEENPDNWPEVSKDPEELPCINDLTASLLHSSSLGKMPTPFLSWGVFLPCFCPK